MRGMEASGWLRHQSSATKRQFAVVACQRNSPWQKGRCVNQQADPGPLWVEEVAAPKAGRTLWEMRKGPLEFPSAPAQNDYPSGQEVQLAIGRQSCGFSSVSFCEPREDGMGRQREKDLVG